MLANHPDLWLKLKDFTSHMRPDQQLAFQSKYPTERAPTSAEISGSAHRACRHAQVPRN